MKIQPSYLSDFCDDVIVNCPNCQEPAHLIRKGAGEGHTLSCLSCSRTRDWSEDQGRSFIIPSGGPRLEAFGLELSLQIACRGGILWAYNLEHLDYLEDLLSSKLRERRRDEITGWSNASIDSRLPKWMKTSKNRSEIIKSIRTLRKRWKKRLID